MDTQKFESTNYTQIGVKWSCQVFLNNSSNVRWTMKSLQILCFRFPHNRRNGALDTPKGKNGALDTPKGEKYFPLNDVSDSPKRGEMMHSIRQRWENGACYLTMYSISPKGDK